MNWLRSAAGVILLHVAFQITTAVIVLAFVYQSAARDVRNEMDHAASAARQAIGAVYRISGDDGVVRLAHELNAVSASTNGFRVRLVRNPKGSGAPGAGVAGTHETFRVGSHVVSIVFAIDPIRGLARTILLAMGGAVLLGLEAGLLTGIFLLRQSNKRLTLIADGASRVERGALSERIKRSGSGDPFDRLSAALNRMFDRIERLMEEMRAVTDALAHDIRSPIMRMRVIAERAQQSAGTETREDLTKIVHETHGIIKMLSDTLEISRTEAGMHRDQFRAFEVGYVARDLIEAYAPLAAEAGLRLIPDVADHTIVSGHESLIGRAIANLIDNAIRYSGGKGTIRVRIGDLTDRVLVEVSDEGVGIDEHEREAALRRFSRLQTAGRQPGSGLGLSLVQSIVTLHGGTLLLRDNQPGLSVTFDIPRPNALPREAAVYPRRRRARALAKASELSG